jgi:hypothetical protein
MKAYQFHAMLRDYEPVIWRRFQVSENVAISRLGYIVMTLFEMKASHAFSVSWYDDAGAFVKSEVDTGDGYHDYDFEATSVKLKDLRLQPDAALVVHYDYGDNWRVVLRLEEVITDPSLSRKLPRAIDGEMYGIVEDCGGTDRLAELVEEFKKKKGKRYIDLKNWLRGWEFDMTEFDLKEMNQRLKKVPLIYERLYELHDELTNEEFIYLERLPEEYRWLMS